MDQSAHVPVDEKLYHGVPQIARRLNASPRRTQWLIEKRMLPVFKIGKLWCAREGAIREHIASLEAGANHNGKSAPQGADT